MLTSPMHAAERSATSTLLTSQCPKNICAQGKVSQVKVDHRTGKLVRTIAGSSTNTLLPLIPLVPPARIDALVEQSAHNHGVDPLLVHSVIQVESGYNAHAISSAGAEGLMQLMPGTSRMLGVGNSFDPAENIDAGVRYLKSLQDLYHDDRLAIAAYNAGPKAVDKYKEVPPYAETESYVALVGQRYRSAYARARANDSNTTDSAKPTANNTGADLLAMPQAMEYNAGEYKEEHPKLERFIDDQGRLYLKTAAN